MVTNFATGPQRALTKVGTGLAAYLVGKGPRSSPRIRATRKLPRYWPRSPPLCHPSRAEHRDRILATGPTATEIAGKTVARGVAQHHPTARAAIARRQELGPDAAVFNVGTRPTGQASGLAALPTAGSARLRNVAHQQIENAGPRLQADIDQVFGPQLSRYDRAIAGQQARQGQAPAYQAFRGHPFDAAPVNTLLSQLIDQFPQTGPANRLMQEVAENLRDRRTGLAINDAGNAIGVRTRIRDMITEAGGGENIPGAFQIGLRTQQGAALIQLYRAINDGLPPNVRQADAVLADEARVMEAYEMGRTRILGGGNAMVEPERLAADFPRMSANERRALLQGTSRAVNQIAGDVRFQRNAGTAVVNPICHPQQSGSHGHTGAGECGRNRGGGSARERPGWQCRRRHRQFRHCAAAPGSQGVWRDIAPQANPRALEAGVGALAAGPLGGVVLPAASKTISSVIEWMTGNRNARIQDAAAHLLAAQGGNADRVLQQLYDIQARLRPGNVARREIGRLINFFVENPLFVQQMGQPAEPPGLLSP